MDKIFYNLIDADKVGILVKEIKMMDFDAWATIEITYEGKKGIITYIRAGNLAQIASPDGGDGRGTILDLALPQYFTYPLSKKIEDKVKETIKKEFFYHTHINKKGKVPVTIDFEVERKMEEIEETKIKEEKEAKIEDEFVNDLLDAIL